MDTIFCVPRFAGFGRASGNTSIFAVNAIVKPNSLAAVMPSITYTEKQTSCELACKNEPTPLLHANLHIEQSRPVQMRFSNIDFHRFVIQLLFPLYNGNTDDHTFFSVRAKNARFTELFAKRIQNINLE